MGKSVSLVLSSGGARGVAHIGVIEELTRQGFEIKSIAGTSMGALVGGIYASGNMKDFREWMCDLDKKAVFNLVDFTISADGLVKGNRVIKELKKIVPDVYIEDLSVSYAAVATDVKHKQEVVFREGSLYKAIRASISIPTVFKPCMSGGMILIDGGVLNPIPINRVRRTKDDLLIAVDVNSPVLSEKSVANKKVSAEEAELNYLSFLMRKGIQFLPKIPGTQLNYYTLLSQSCSIMIQQISALTIELCQPDILIKIPMNSYGPFHFYKSEEIIKTGEIATRKALFDFQSKKINEKP